MTSIVSVMYLASCSNGNNSIHYKYLVINVKDLMEIRSNSLIVFGKSNIENDNVDFKA